MVGASRLVVRKIAPESKELQRVRDLLDRAYESVLGVGFDPTYQEHIGDLESRMASAEVAVCTIGSDIVGCVTFVRDDRSPYAEWLSFDECGIRMLGVAPEFGGRGAGRALVEWCVMRGIEAGRSGVFLHSTPQMEVAHRLYESMDFRRVLDRDVHLDDGTQLLAFRRALWPR